MSKPRSASPRGLHEVFDSDGGVKHDSYDNMKAGTNIFLGQLENLEIF